MHVVHISDVLPPRQGGIETALTTLFRALPDIRFTVLTAQPARDVESFQENHVTVRHLQLLNTVLPAVSSILPERARRYAYLITFPMHEWQRRELAARMEADLVHFHSYSAFRYYANLPLDPIRHAMVDWLRDFSSYLHPVLFTDHSLFGGSPEDFRSIRNDLLVQRLHNIVCVEQSGKENVDAYAREQGLKIRSWWIQNPVDTTRFFPAPLSSTSRVIVGYAGRYEKKGIQRILELVGKAEDWADFRLALAVRDADFDQASRELRGAGVRVSWNVPNSEMPRFYNSIHIFLDPWSFGTPRTSIEALSCGRVVVRLRGAGSFPGELPTEISPLVDADDPTAVFRQLRRFQDRDALERTGEASRQLAERRYSVQKVAAAYREVYEAVAEPSSSAFSRTAIMVQHKAAAARPPDR